MQLVNPDLNVKAQIERCLQYVQNAYKAPRAGDSAWDAWNLTFYKHYDQNFPQNLYFPVWFSYCGTVDGVYANWGHVVIYYNGICYSSPFTDKNTHDVLGSIREVEKTYNCKFVGWSEDIGGLRVIKGDNMVTKGDAEKAWVLGMDLPLSHEGYKGFESYWIGKSTTDMLQHLIEHPRHEDIVTKARNFDSSYVPVTEQLFKYKKG